MWWNFALHMHGKHLISFHGCECMIGKSTPHLAFDWVGSVNGTVSNRVA